jgi:hypothetical protein
MNSGKYLSLLPPPLSIQKVCQHENTDFDWLTGNWDSHFEFSASDSHRTGTAAEPASQAAERVDQTGDEYALPLLRRSGWGSGQAI